MRSQKAVFLSKNKLHHWKPVKLHKKDMILIVERNGHRQAPFSACWPHPKLFQLKRKPERMQCVNLASTISLNSLGNCKNTLHRHVTGYYRAVRHSSPYVLLVTLIEISKFWNEDGILLYCLPPHSSHITQPLDVGFFKPLKVSWAKACDTFSLEHPGTPVSKDVFSSVFRKAWEASVNVWCYWFI